MNRRLVTLLISLVASGALAIGITVGAEPPRSPEQRAQAALLEGRPAEGTCFVSGDALIAHPGQAELDAYARGGTNRRVRGGVFVGSPEQLAASMGGKLIVADEEEAWVLSEGAGRREATKSVALRASDGTTIWFMGGMLRETPCPDGA